MVLLRGAAFSRVSWGARAEGVFLFGYEKRVFLVTICELRAGISQHLVMGITQRCVK